jgi:integrase
MPAKLTKRFCESQRPTEKPYEARDAEQKGLLLRVEPSGTKTFWLSYTLKGKKNRFKLGTYPNVSAEGARAIAKATSGDIARGIDPAARKKADRAQADKDRLATLKTFLADRYEPYALGSMKTGAQQLVRIRSDFADRLDKPMTTLTTFWAEGLRRQWKKDGKSAKTINRDFQRIEAVLARAVQWKIMDTHPLADFKPLKTDQGGRVRYLTAVEEAGLRAELIAREDRMRAERIRMNTWLIERHRAPLPDRVGDHLDHLRPLVLLALNTGMRRGELFSLRWENVRLGEKWLTVIAATSKSGQTRRIPLNAEALAVLTAWRERQTETTGLVFPGVEGERLNNINKSWNGVVKKAGLDNFKFHDLRHSFASRLVQSAVDLNTVRELLGHKDIQTTQIYAHLDPDNLAKAVAKVARS